MNLVLFCNTFKDTTKPLRLDVNPMSIEFKSSSDGYEFENSESLNKLSFVLTNKKDTESTYKYLHENVRYEDKNRYVQLLKSNEPRIQICFYSGDKGLRNSAYFTFE